MSNYTLDWYLVVAAPGQDDRAKINLDRLDLITWLPTFTGVVKRNGVKLFKTRKLCSGYVFMAFPPGRPHSWLDVRDAPGVYGVICHEGRPLRVPNDDVAGLMSRCMHGLFDQDRKRRGAVVRIVGGDHAGRKATITNVQHDSDAVTVLLKGMGALTFETVALGDLRLVA